jgi:hypothetical protein
MKAEFIAEFTPPPFEPVTVALTFETQAEVNEWHNMMGFSVTIPKLVNPKQMTYEQLGKSMGQLESLLKNKVVGT